MDIGRVEKMRNLKFRVCFFPWEVSAKFVNVRWEHQFEVYMDIPHGTPNLPAIGTSNYCNYTKPSWNPVVRADHRFSVESEVIKISFETIPVDLRYNLWFIVFNGQLVRMEGIDERSGRGTSK